MMVYQNCSEEIMKMDLEQETTFSKGRPCSRKTAIFVLLGTVCMIILMIMTSVILFHQQRTFSELESLMNVHSSNQTSVKPDLQVTVQVKNIETLMSNLASSLSSVSSKQEENQQKLEREQGLSHTEVKSLMNNLSSAVSALTSKLNDAVGNQEQKQTETQKLLDNLKSAVTSLQSDQQDKQRDFESLSSSVSEMKSSVSDLSSSVSSLSSQLSVIIQDDSQTEVKSLMNNLSSAVSALTAKLNDAEERIMNTLQHLRSNMSNKTADVPLTCKYGWISYKSSCFLFSSNSLNWTEARDYCKAQGALLLKIQDNDAEWAFLNHHTIPTFYWVGLTDQTTGQWRWADDTPYTMNKERWNPGQPDDWKVGEVSEDCGVITRTGKLNDGHCYTKFRFICRVQFLN